MLQNLTFPAAHRIERRMIGLDVVLEDARWTVLEPLARRAIPAALGHLNLTADDLELAVMGCDDARIATLNTEFRGKPTPTNVLSWPAADLNPGDAPQDPELGDIAIAFDTCAREAADQGKPFEDHVTHLLVHATLHLLGYDHENDAEAAQMEHLEVEILGNLGLPDPY